MEDMAEKLRVLKEKRATAYANRERLQNESEYEYEQANKLGEEIDALEEQMKQQRTSGHVSLFLHRVGNETMVSSRRILDAQEEVLVENGVIGDAIIRSKLANDPPGQMEVRARYFKLSGKWYAEGRWWTKKKSLHEVLAEFEGMQIEGKVPGLSGDGKEFYVLLESDAEEMNPPYLLLPRSMR
jgi:hypothetical protein